jgi:hypothetical protein
VLLALVLTLAGCRSSSPLGHVAIDRVQTSRAERPIVLLNLHENESTSVRAAQAYLARNPSPDVTLVVLRHDGERNLTFASGGHAYRIDPNRMFSDGGALASIQSLSDGAPRPERATRYARRLAADVLQAAQFDRARYLVALHNNTDARYSAASYLPDSAYAAEADAVHLEPGRDPDDFFFVTERSLFERLVAAGFNAVLQAGGGQATDDGSLSVYAALRGVPYVNVEAQHGHLDAQTEMFEALMPLLQDDL